MSSISGRFADVLSNFDDEPVVTRGRAAGVETENEEALRQAQLELDAMKEQCHTLQEKVQIAEANKPRKSAKAAVPDALSAFDTEIQSIAKKFGILVEMFPPSKDVLGRPVTPGVSNTSPPSSDIVGKSRYASALAEEAAVLAELDSTLPPHIQNIRMSHHFANQFGIEISNGRSSELHKLRNVAKDLFQLPSHYFTCEIAPRHLEFPEICALLGVPQNAVKPKYPMIPPLLYVNHKANPRTPFSNWELLASILRVVFWGQTALTHDSTRHPGGKANGTLWGITFCTPGCLAWAAIIMSSAIFIVSPDSQFPKDGTGANSEIPYQKLFVQYKHLFISNWDTPYLRDLVGKVNQRVFGKTKARVSNVATMNEEDLTADIDAAMAAMAMELPETDSGSQGTDTNSEQRPVVDIDDPLPSSALTGASTWLSSGSVAGTNSNNQALERVAAAVVPHIVYGVEPPLEHSEQLLGLPEEADHADAGSILAGPSAAGRGTNNRRRGTKRGSKVATDGTVTHTTRRNAAK